MMILDAKTLGKRIRSERMRIGLTQEEFAEMLENDRASCRPSCCI